MARWRSLFCLLFAALLLGVGCNRRDGETVAVVQGKKISLQEFQDRYRLYLQSTNVRDNIVVRKSVLDNMINEALVLEDMHRFGWDSDAAAREKLEEIRMQALINGYGKKKILDTISVTDRELAEEFRLSNTKVKARYLYAASMDGALKLREKLHNGASFEALAKDVFEDPGLANNGGSLGYIAHGEMEPAFDNVAFSLPVGQISNPVKIKVGYAIILVDDKVQIPLASAYDFAKKKESLTESVLERKIDQFTKQIVHQLSDQLNPRFDESAVRLLYDHWDALVSLPQAASEGVRENGEDLASKKIVEFDNGSWTIGNVLGKMEKTSRRQRQKVNSADELKEFILGLASRDELIRRAEESGMESDPDVKNEIRNANLRYFLKRWATHVEDSIAGQGVSDEEIRREYELNKSMYLTPPEVNVAEILVRSSAEADKLYKQARAGADFTQLARKHSIRLWAAKRGGELGFGTISTFGILGKTFFSAKVGEIIPPQRVDPYVGVFKILARRGDGTKTFEEAKDRIAKELLAHRKQEGFKNAVASLRSPAHVKVYEDVLANVLINE